MRVIFKGEVVAGAAGNNGVCHGSYGSGDLCALRLLRERYLLKVQRFSVIAFGLIDGLPGAYNLILLYIYKSVHLYKPCIVLQGDKIGRTVGDI